MCENSKYWNKIVYNFKYNGDISYQIKIGFGCWLGYVKIPINHKLSDMYNDEIYDKLNYKVHGKFTFASKEDKHFIYGFDTNHYNDVNLLPLKNGGYNIFHLFEAENNVNLWTLERMKIETYNLCKAFDEA